MKKFRIKGTIDITYTWQVDEEIEVEDDEGEDDAFEAVIEELDPITSFTSDTDTHDCECTEIDDSAVQREAERVAELRKLEQWNAWALGQTTGATQ